MKKTCVFVLFFLAINCYATSIENDTDYQSNLLIYDCNSDKSCAFVKSEIIKPHQTLSLSSLDNTGEYIFLVNFNSGPNFRFNSISPKDSCLIYFFISKKGSIVPSWTNSCARKG